jgi:hypothetical protein
MDNLNIHRKKSLTDHLGPAQADYLWSRLKVHYTPKHGSWLNQAEIELSLISRQCLGKRRIGLDFPDVSLVTAITLDNIIASRQPSTSALLFHELAHAVQFCLLGVSAFALLYVRGLLVAASYDQIPLERCAVELDYRFETEHSPFDVENEVRHWIQRGL